MSVDPKENFRMIHREQPAVPVLSLRVIFFGVLLMVIGLMGMTCAHVTLLAPRSFLVDALMSPVNAQSLFVSVAVCPDGDVSAAAAMRPCAVAEVSAAAEAAAVPARLLQRRGFGRRRELVRPRRLVR